MPVGYVSSPGGPDRSPARTPPSVRRTVCPHCQKPIASPLPSPTGLSPSTALRHATASDAGSTGGAPAVALLAPLPIGAEPLVTFGELERWAAIVGVPVPSSPVPPSPGAPPASANASASASANAFPLLPPPPPADQPVKRAAFGFFRRASHREDNEDSDDDAGPTGYARIGAGSDVESDDEGGLSAKSTPRKSRVGQEKVVADVAVRDRGETAAEFPASAEGSGIIDEGLNDATVAAGPTDTGADDLRQCLREVLARVNMLSQSHAALLSTHAALTTDLKIARSNLAMAEANTEMLEAQLQRSARAQLGPAAPDPPRTVPAAASPASRDASPRPGTPGSAAAAPTTDARRRPASLQLSEQKAGVFGFFGSKKRATAHGLPPLADAADISPAAPVQALRQRAPSLTRSASQGAVPLSASSLSSPAAAVGAASESAQVAALRAEVARMAAEQTAAAAELDALKRGKKEIEAELEGLSQALFEEANSMVAEERKRRAEVEDALREAREERNVLRETVKVLGGAGEGAGVGAGAGQAAPQDAAEQEAPAHAHAAEVRADDAAGDWKPRDLDKHYEALRKSIQHVADAPASPTRTGPVAGEKAGGADASAAAGEASAERGVEGPESDEAEGSAPGVKDEQAGVTEREGDEEEDDARAAAHRLSVVPGELGPDPWAA
ncbi:hypothetical protein Q5752_000421 [Cryptotrichosporon argae]